MNSPEEATDIEPKDEDVGDVPTQVVDTSIDKKLKINVLNRLIVIMAEDIAEVLKAIRQDIQK